MQIKVTDKYFLPVLTFFKILSGKIAERQISNPTMISDSKQVLHNLKIPILRF